MYKKQGKKKNNNGAIMMKAIADRERDSKIKAAFGLGHFRTYYSTTVFLLLTHFFISLISRR